MSLHPQEPDDAPFVAELLSSPEVRADIGRSVPTTEAGVREGIEGADPDRHGFVVQADGEAVGTCKLDVTQPDWGYGELAYIIHPEAQGNGYATAAVDGLARYAFDERRLHKLGADVYETNPASQRVLEKVGFREEGRRRDHAFVEGEHVDLVEFGLLAEDWRDS